MRQTLVRHTHHVRSVAFSPTGGLLASAGDNHVVRLWDVVKECERCTLVGQARAANQTIRFSLNGRTAATGGSDCRVRLWDLAVPGSGAPD